MEVSLETLAGLDRRLLIQLPAESVDADFEQRVAEMAKKAKISGFRPGKVPVNEIKRRHGKALRMEIINEVMRKSFFDAVSQQKLTPVGYPKFNILNDAAKKGLEFSAEFEVYPEIKVQEFGALKIEKPVAEITEADVDHVIESVREQHKEWEELAGAASSGDKVLIDYVGKIEGEAFDGGSAEDASLVLGSGQMIDGFEQGIEGATAGETRILQLKFPDQYHGEEVAGKNVEFIITVKKVLGKKLPEVNESFVEKLGVPGGLSSFRDEVRKNMTHEKEQAEKRNIKEQIFKGLVEQNKIELPKTLVKNEIRRLQQRMFQQFGGGQQFDPSLLPEDLFVERAQESAAVGLIISAIIKENNLKADADKVRAMIDDLASRYDQPEQVVNWYYNNNEKLAEIEAVVLEDAVIAHILETASVSNKEISYESLFKSQQGQAAL
jgi:trigger factor